MAKVIVFGALFSLGTLHFAMSLQETVGFPTDSRRKAQTSEERDLNRFMRFFSTLDDSIKDSTHNNIQNVPSELEKKSYRISKHRQRRGVLSWFASYFQSDSEAAEEPDSEHRIENIHHPTERHFSQNHPVTTVTKTGLEEASNNGQSFISSDLPRGKTAKMFGTTRIPRSTASSAVTNFFRKVNPQNWLTTMSAFLHNGVDIDKLHATSGESSRTGQFESSTPEYRSTFHGQTAEVSPGEKHKPHKIRHHKHHPNKIRVGSTPQMPVKSDDGDNHPSSTNIPINRYGSSHSRSEPGPQLSVDKHVEKKGNEDKPKQCENCRFGGRTRANAATKGLSEEEVKFIRKNMVAELMAEKLRLDPRDLIGLNTNKSLEKMKLPMLPRAVLDETRERNSLIQEEDDFYARDQEAIVAGDDMGRDCVGMRSTGCYDFKFNGEVQGEVESAALWLYKTNDRRDITEQTFIVYELERPRGSRSLRRRNLIAREGTLTKEGWVKLNVTRPVRRWLEKRRDGEMLAIRCKTCETHNYRALFGTKHGYKPLLIIRYVDKYNTRIRRSEESCNPATECCKRPLAVNFNEINLPTVLQPANLDIDYCYGYCDGIDRYTYNHTSIKQRVRWTQNITEDTREQLKPCCVPLQLRDTFILTVENEIIVRKVLPKVIVDRCGCV